ncbi:MAG: hypothetical protein ABSF83_14185 [Nitrososphaerales archaeon]|jgi:tRNA(Ile2) C34 agmatinyltransferase TiaS
MSSAYRETGAKEVAACNFCSKQLGKEYYFRCHVCGATYCYIHMTKHSRAHKPAMPVPVSSIRA